MQTVILAIKAKPGSKYTKLEVKADELVVNIAAQPVDGEANKELIRLISKALKLRQTQIELKVGATSKHKLIKIISEYTKEEILNKLKEFD